MKILVKGTEVNLTNSNYVAEGGEGRVYARGGTAYKVYHDPSKMLPLGKIAELKKLTHKNIIRPEDVITDTRGSAIGYTMRFVKGCTALCQLFPRSFRDRHGIDDTWMGKLVLRLQELVAHCHSAQVLIVDLNEMNFLAAPDFKDLYAIDADSYQTPSYKATAIMDSVRDWQAKTFSEVTDWYSFGILSFQMFTGLHPFKGKYHGTSKEFSHKLPSDSPDDAFAITRRRMQKNVSVFHPDVRMPPAAYPLDVIPKPYRAWFEALFVKGLRTPPPDGFGGVVIAVPAPVMRTLVGSGRIEITEVSQYRGNIVGVWTPRLGGKPVVLTDQALWVGDREVHSIPTNTEIGFTDKVDRVISFSPTGGVPTVKNLTDSTVVNFGLNATDMMTYEGRVYVKNADKILEIVLTDMGQQVVATTKTICQVLEHATHLFDGVVVQKLLQATYVSVFPGGMNRQLHVKELDGRRIVDAKYDGGVLMVVAEKHGQYDRLVFRFDREHQSYDVRVVRDVGSGSLNFITLDTGVCVCLNEEDKLELFSKTMGAQGLKIVEDTSLGGDMRLVKLDSKVGFYRGSQLYRMTMK